MRLLADAMLGRLAKWLRIVGYDTAYVVDTDDFAVMRLARTEGRLVLTRDRALARRRGVRALLVESEVLQDQLCQVCAAVGPPPDAAFSRCPVCNHSLVQAPAELVAARLPLYVQRAHERFSLCVACDQLYWPGSHWRRMQSLVAELRNGAASATISPDIQDLD